jgi:steroid 5-alpha reductase family enzyme
MTFSSLLLLGGTLSLAAFALLWILCLKVRNYGFVDAAWAFGIAILAPLYAVLTMGAPLRRVLFASVGVIWSLRLGFHLLRRLLRHHPSEDPRYRTLREQWKSPAAFLIFFEIQAATVVLFSLPFLIASLNPAPGLRPVEAVGLLLALAGIIGESIADHQMRTFSSDPRNRGALCNTGLWRYSRHPNYFFESVVWWGFFVAATGSPWGWCMIICPLLMLWFLLRVTGIPLTEEHSLRSKGESYHDYQRTTSAFIPWFPKSPAATDIP